MLVFYGTVSSTMMSTESTNLRGVEREICEVVT